MEINTRIDEYLGLLSEITDKVGDEQAAAHIMHEIAKDERAKRMRAERRTRGRNRRGTRSSEPATKSQLEWLHDLKAKFEPGITRQEASRLISKRTGRP